jgi:UDP-glucose 4-epimerase
MTVLVTGHRGRIGAVVARLLEDEAFAVRGFDAADGDDVRDAAALRRAAEGAEAIVHLAGLPDDRGGDPADVMAVNLGGTWNVLPGARAAGVERVVYFSSGKALGMLEREPAYLPIDDDHPGLPSRPYGLAKWLA